MKFSMIALSGLASAVSAASLPSRFTLIADDNKPVLTDGQYAYIGGNVSNTRQKLILSGGSTGGISYTAKNAVPTAFQTLYIIEDNVSPIGLTIPHSGAVPEGANTTAFGVSDEGLLTQGGKPWFAIDGYGDVQEKQVYWYGAHNAEFEAANLKVQECTEEEC
ncbi:hypothetical protein BO70DRAFT_359657 [Aspergillus heteromorphus CBS 117.55]|uniref:Uncharacterized protein n=1 Tax=Aspergillus heteromorphus CBS 117.55 TaxID=1448321 RepID=A0A317WS83_9EURO|nr:uncharacterized protein BO70DRAFT_359657 [Aspergillus heteromorphus CBS 117.55]PWY88182.1 hypothetical protein BO70DRAFT_359657 [Aspergillus heteromorphus CBS 117.55]